MHNAEQFDSRPRVRRRRLNQLPDNPETAVEGSVVGRGRFPSWLHRPLPKGENLFKTNSIIEGKRLHTVCEEAKCPNLLECFSQKTATFLILGKECTRACGFCDIDFSKTPHPPEEDEPRRVAESAKELGLRHIVITMVARDDLHDGGAAHLARVIQAIREEVPGATVEVLTSDLGGSEQAWNTVIEAQPDIFNHNIETVRTLTPRVRHTATYERTLNLLRYVKDSGARLFVKSGLMVGLGETKEQVKETIRDLHEAGCAIITMGQYLQPNRHKLRVKEFVTPEQFKAYEEYGYQMGVQHMYCGPFVRSSYNAGLVIQRVNGQTQSINSH